MATAKKSSRIWDFLVIAAVVYLGSTLIFRYVFPPKTEEDSMPVVISMQDASVRLGATPVVEIHNQTQRELIIPDRCPRPPVDVFSVSDTNQLTDITSEEIVVPCVKREPIPAGETATVDLGPWKQSNFAKAGLYELELPITVTGSVVDQSGATVGGSEASQYREGIITRFTISEPGIFTKLFRAFITKPLLNGLIFIASVTPGHNLGVAIILLTLAVKLLLFVPTQHALEGQKKMQMLQPKFEAIRRQYKDDPKKMQEETMKVWKEHKVNPFQALVPLLVQFPILIGLFYVIRDGSHLELSRHLIYPFYQDLDWTFSTQFLGLDLTKSYIWIFPPVLVVLQFIQMWLSFKIADKKKAKEIKDKTTPQADTPQEIQQRIMMYFLPLLIGFFAIQFPSAVSLYWFISTVFAIGQQLIVNREHIRP
jgi:YidC/Oxa1 family membrane protein insertase